MTPDYIIESVARHFGVSPRAMKGRSRKDHICVARHLAAWLMREHTFLSHADVGNYLGNRDHSSVVFAVKKINGYIAQRDPRIVAALAAVLPPPPTERVAACFPTETR